MFKSLLTFVLGIIIGLADLTLMPKIFHSQIILLTPIFIMVFYLIKPKNIFVTFLGAGLIWDIYSSNIFGLWLLIFAVNCLILLILKHFFIQREVSILFIGLVIFYGSALIIDGWLLQAVFNINILLSLFLELIFALPVWLVLDRLILHKQKGASPIKITGALLR